jgi:signal transduction histidine kinase
VRRLEQAFSNLLDNAVRHTPPGGAVAVRAQVGDATVRVAVQNSGSLIPADDLPHLFERFYQVANSGGNEGHSGLGLAIASEVVHAHGGTITARSSEQEGTEFTVTLPLGQRKQEG